MLTRVIVVLLVSLVHGSLGLAQVQQPKKVARIGYIIGSSPNGVTTEAFRQGLRELGYVEGQNIVIEYRYAEGKSGRLPDLAAELVRLNVEVIVAAGGSPAIQAARNATRTIPIVMTGLIDPVAWGFIASLDRPGGNITGLSHGGYELIGKRLELLKETVPRASRVAVFWNRPLAADLISKEMQAASHALGLQIQSLEVRGPNDLEGAFRAAVKGRAGGLTVGSGPVFGSNRNRILDFAATKRLPGVYPWREYVEDGGLMSYAPNLPDAYRRAATYVDKILKGGKPADLPVEQPTKFEFIINLKAAKQIGLTIPPNVLARADKVIK
jgi:putative tryptophan/tyrosine transport system substrate-binding protein